MTRTSRRLRLGVEPLERRDTPAVLSPILPAPDVPRAPDLVRYGSLTSMNGVITATGTDFADIIRVENYTPVVSAQRAVRPADTVHLAAQAVVTITDALGRVRTDVAGQALRLFFDRDGNTTVMANGLGGNDRIFNGTSKSLMADGGGGSDTVTGGAGTDILHGGTGNDLMYGGGARDVMNGDTGNDILLGNAGDDLLYGDAHNDTLHGGVGNDVLSGGEHEDLLLGEGDNDRLSGGGGNDNLQGGIGDDGLFGGAGKDTLTGGTGIDRYLKWQATGNVTTVRDLKAGESVTVFQGTTAVSTVDHGAGVNLRYAAAEWSEEEIMHVDEGMDFLHHHVGNTKMLKTHTGANLTMLRMGAYLPYDAADGVNDATDQKANAEGPEFGGFNLGGGRIIFGPNATAATAIHELAHNWEDENSRFTEWKALSGWVAGSQPGPTQTLSGDGLWVYDTSAGGHFRSEYGKTNPYEDFATSFEAYYDLHTGQLSISEMYRLAPKLNFMGLFVASLS